MYGGLPMTASTGGQRGRVDVEEIGGQDLRAFGQRSGLVGLVGFAFDPDQSIEQIVRAKLGETLADRPEEGAVAAGWLEDSVACGPDRPMREEARQLGRRVEGASGLLLVSAGGGGRDYGGHATTDRAVRRARPARRRRALLGSGGRPTIEALGIGTGGISRKATRSWQAR